MFKLSCTPSFHVTIHVFDPIVLNMSTVNSQHNIVAMQLHARASTPCHRKQAVQEWKQSAGASSDFLL